MKVLFAFLLITILTAGAVNAQTSSAAVAVDVNKNSSLSINGSSNIVNFKLIQSSENFIQKNMIITASQNDKKLYLSENQLIVPIRSFTSSNKMALRDFYKLLKSDEYPTMDIHLYYIHLPDTTDSTAGIAVVDVTITDVTKKYNFPFKIEKNGTRYIFNVEKQINIRDFGLEPPVQMMGMLKVDEMININLKMICDIQPAESALLNLQYNPK